MERLATTATSLTQLSSDQSILGRLFRVDINRFNFRSIDNNFINVITSLCSKYVISLRSANECENASMYVYKVICLTPCSMWCVHIS
jgi:hypothetical protein